MNVDDRAAGVVPPARLAWRGLSTAIVAWVVSLVGLGLMTALVQGPGTGGNTAKAVVAEGLRHYLAHRAAVVATGRLQRP